MSATYDIAVVGATGLVGETMLEILAQRDFPVGKLHALASSRSAGRQVTYRGRRVRVEDLAEFDFAGVHLALFSAGGSVSEGTFRTILRDHAHGSYAICRHAEPAEEALQQTATRASLIMDLKARSLSLAPGQPCVTPYQSFVLSGLL